MKAKEIRSQSWFDQTGYPFTSQYFSTPDGDLHYVDEGQGEPILFVHGTPVWSYLYRDFIREFSRTHRCLAVDHLGFGLSDKPEKAGYRPRDHAQRLEMLVKHLGLKNITLVVHDFGGPIGLGFALANPDLIGRLVIFNTWMWETAHDPRAVKIDRTLRSGLGKFLYLNLNFSPRFLFKQAFADKRKVGKVLHMQIIRVFPDRKSRMGLWEIGKALVGESAWYGQLWEQRAKLAPFPKLILWGMEDKFITPENLEKWQSAFPEAQIRRFSCGHFVQEEAGEEARKALGEFLKEG
ncbi:MAG: alpha/beta fold hydrolase [Bacteroidia bacterium]|nr:alpha/beta fold hydrolase [Bacteroidia bacterium]